MTNENEMLRGSLESGLIGLASTDSPEIDICSVHFLGESGEMELVEYTRRTDHNNTVSVAFDDDTTYVVAVSPIVYDTLKGAFETCEDFQDVVTDTVVGDSDDEGMPPGE